MIDSEIVSFIQKEIKKQVNILLTGVSGPNAQNKQTIQNMYAGMKDQTDRPIVHPYGLVSRAPQGTNCAVARFGDHPANRYTIGHLDEKRPELAEGDVILYNEFGAQIRLETNEIKLGSADADEPLVLGNVFVDLMNALIAEIEKIQVVCTAPGVLSSVPANVAQFEVIKAQYITSTDIVSDSVFSQKIITPGV